MPRWAFLWLGLVLLVAPAGGAGAELRVLDPRPFGYFLGDTLTRTIEIDGPAGESLVASSLPAEGPATYWLEISRVDAASEASRPGTRHVITIAYQLFYAAIDPRTLDIPGHTIALQVGETQRTVAIPPLPVTISPLREIFPGKERDRETNLLRPDALPQLAPVGAWRTGAIGSAVLALAGLLLLAHHNAWGPFRRRAARPFTRAVAEIKALPGELALGEAYRSALTVLHRAFDESAGRRVFADDLTSYIDGHSEHRASADAIERFFEASRRVFFAADVDGGLDVLPRAGLQALAESLAREERAGR